MASTVTTTIDGKIITAEEFYAQARRWAAIVRNTAKANASRFSKGKTKQAHTYKTGNKAGKTEQKLRNSTRYIIDCGGGRHSRESGNLPPESVGFKLPIHGIYREWAVGYGQPRVAGKYVSKNSRIKRNMVDWIDIPIEKHKQKLFDLATEYWGDQVVVNSFGAKKM